jgi:excinuclease ABC subunit B
VDLLVHDDPLTRQSAVEEGRKQAGRSSAGRAGQRGGNVRRRGR